MVEVEERIVDGKNGGGQQEGRMRWRRKGGTVCVGQKLEVHTSCTQVMTQQLELF